MLGVDGVASTVGMASATTCSTTTAGAAVLQYAPPPATLAAVRRASIASAGSLSTDGGFSDDESLRSFDAFDDDIGGRDALDVYTVEWARRVLHAIDACQKPVLVHCETGVAACTLVLLRAALAKKSGPKQVLKWARDLGHPLDDHDDLAAIVLQILHAASHHRAHGAADPVRASTL